MITSSAWSGKKYAVYGLARSGRATVEALLASGAEVLAWDDRAGAREPFVGRTAVADPLGADLTGYAGVVVSPGVPLNTHPIAGRVHHILKTAGVPTTMGGNIGLPILEQDPLPDGGVYVLELSSFQIDLTYSLDCDVAVLLNITPDHLDRYDSFEDYAASKKRLFAMQSNGGAAINLAKGSGNPGQAWGDVGEEAQEIIVAPAPEPGSRFLSAHAAWPGLQGPHNLQNSVAAIVVCEALGVGHDAIASGLRTYPGLPHRMERVAEIGGVAWINDSKGTNTAATAPALAAFDNIHWIVGGLAKEPGLGECEAELGHVKAAYTIGKSGEDFARALEGRVRVTRSERLERAVADAAAAAMPGDTVLLSPACASFDQFRDFEHRGEVFRQAVAKLQEAAA